MARERPNTPILAATPNQITYNRLALVWGVTPVLVEEFQTIDEMIEVVVKTAREANVVTDGDLKRILTRSGYRPDLVVGDLGTAEGAGSCQFSASRAYLLFCARLRSSSRLARPAATASSTRPCRK